MFQRRSFRRNMRPLIGALILLSIAAASGFVLLGGNMSLARLTQIELNLPEWRPFGRNAAEELGTADSGSLLIYSSIDETQLQDYIGVFRADHPDILIDYEIMDAAELPERIIAEKSAPRADLIWGASATTLLFLDWSNTLTPYAPLGLETIPAQFQDTFYPPVWVGQVAWMSAFCVNESLLASAGVPVPHSWLELADPVYREMILMPDPTQSGTGYMTLLVFHDLIGEAELWNFYSLLDKNVLAYIPSATQACRDVADGIAPIGVSFGLNAIEVQSKGAPIEVIFPAEGSGWDMEASALTRKFPVKPAAKTLMDFIVSAEAMHHYAQHYAITAIKLDYIPIPDGYPENPETQLMEKDFEWAGANRQRLLREWSQRYAR